MVHVTDAAKAALLATKRKADLDRPEVGLRLALGADGTLGLIPDREKAGDQVVMHEGAMVLLVDPEMSAMVVTGRVMDCRRRDDGSVRFFLRRSGQADHRASSAA